MVAIGPLSIDMYLPGLPEITRSLDASAAAVQLTLTAVVVGLALGQLVAGPLSDRIGRRRPLVVGLGAYAGVSLLCALAPNVDALTGLRFLQGLAGGAGIVIGRAVVRDLYAGAAAARLFSSLMLVTGLAPILAPVIGAQVLKVTDWQGIFVVLAGLALAIVTLAAVALPGDAAAGQARPRRARAHAADAPRPARAALVHRLRADRRARVRRAVRLHLRLVVRPAGDLRALAAGVQPRVRRQRARAGDRQPDQRAARRALRAGRAAAARAAGDRRRRRGARRGGDVGDLGVWPVIIATFVVMSSLSFVMPNSTALALADQAKVAGTASALLGVIQFLVGGLAAPLVGIGGTGSAVPMAVVMLSLATGAVAVNRWL